MVGFKFRVRGNELEPLLLLSFGRFLSRRRDKILLRSILLTFFIYFCTMFSTLIVTNLSTTYCYKPPLAIQLRPKPLTCTSITSTGPPEARAPLLTEYPWNLGHEQLIFILMP